MTVYWSFEQATADERLLFPDAEVACALPFEPAGPPNRTRHVRRITVGSEVYYLKVFAHTQWKNRVRFLCTAPRCRRDGEREARIAAALRQAGIQTARCVATGVSGPRSFYLCAQIQGRPLTDVIHATGIDQHLVKALARFLGGITGQGIVLPDLSLDHVFVLDGSADHDHERHEQGVTFAVLDLHNGRLGRATRRDVRRWLRRMEKSLAGKKISRRTALAFVARLLKAAGLPHLVRSTLATMSPWDTHGRYDMVSRSAGYARRNPVRHQAEMRLLARIWPGRPDDLVFDLPCGAGRLHSFVTDRGERWIGGDRSSGMLAQARAAGARPLLQADACALPLPDRSVDGAVVFRFLHHVDAQVAAMVLGEAARISKRFVVVSYFHPISMHGLRRSLAVLVLGRARTRFSRWPAELDRWMAGHGFRRVQQAAQAPFLRDLWLAGYERM